jgi:hypothetical protein
VRVAGNALLRRRIVVIQDRPAEQQVSCRTLLAPDGANLNVRLDQLRDAARHLVEANPVVQRLASSPEVAALFPTDGCLACPSQVCLVWVAPEHGRRSQQGPYVATGVLGRSSSSMPGYRPGRVRHQPLPARPTSGPGRRSSSAPPSARISRPLERPASHPITCSCHGPVGRGHARRTLALPGVRDCAATARRAVLIGQSDIDTDVALSNHPFARSRARQIAAAGR